MPGSYKLIAVDVHDKVLYQKGHTVERWRTKTAEEITTAVFRAAPVNKRGNKSKSPQTYGGATYVGYLQDHIRLYTYRAGGRRLGAETVSSAEYTMAVIKGTSGGNRSARKVRLKNVAGESRVYPGTFPFYNIPSNPGFGYGWKSKFKGQKANNFLVRGYNRAAARHQALRRMRS